MRRHGLGGEDSARGKGVRAHTLKYFEILGFCYRIGAESVNRDKNYLFAAVVPGRGLCNLDLALKLKVASAVKGHLTVSDEVLLGRVIDRLNVKHEAVSRVLTLIIDYRRRILVCGRHIEGALSVCLAYLIIKEVSVALDIGVNQLAVRDGCGKEKAVVPRCDKVGVILRNKLAVDIEGGLYGVDHLAALYLRLLVDANAESVPAIVADKEVVVLGLGACRCVVGHRGAEEDAACGIVYVTRLKAALVGTPLSRGVVLKV